MGAARQPIPAEMDRRVGWAGRTAAIVAMAFNSKTCILIKEFKKISAKCTHTGMTLKLHLRFCVMTLFLFLPSSREMSHTATLVKQSTVLLPPRQIAATPLKAHQGHVVGEASSRACTRNTNIPARSSQALADPETFSRSPSSPKLVESRNRCGSVSWVGGFLPPPSPLPSH